MTPELAGQIWVGIGAYLGIGFIFAVIFAALIAPRLDPAAAGMKLSVRALIIPGTMLLWPLMLGKTVLRKGPPEQ
ncbi:MAG: hypothetical protein AAGH41_02930 [Pseudomonadota bacterium]